MCFFTKLNKQLIILKCFIQLIVALADVKTKQIILTIWAFINFGYFPKYYTILV